MAGLFWFAGRVTNTCPMHRAGDEYTPDASGRKGVLQFFFRFLMEKIGASQSGICFLHGLSGGRQISALGVGRTMIPPSAPPRAGSLSSLRRGPKFVTRPPAHVEILESSESCTIWHTYVCMQYEPRYTTFIMRKYVFTNIFIVWHGYIYFYYSRSNMEIPLG